jgi:hypothetical protein
LPFLFPPFLKGKGQSIIETTIKDNPLRIHPTATTEKWRWSIKIDAEKHIPSSVIYFGKN